MEIISTINLAECLKATPLRLSSIADCVTKAQHLTALAHSLFELKCAKHISVMPFLTEDYQIQICAQNDKQAIQPGLDVENLVTLSAILCSGLSEFSEQAKKYEEQLAKGEVIHINPAFERVMKNISKLEVTTDLVIGDKTVNLPRFDTTIFKNLPQKPPLHGKGSADLMKFNQKILLITPESVNCHKFKSIEVKFTREQLEVLLELSYQSDLYGQYEVIEAGSSYELVSFNIIQLQLFND